jgi:hypothetical protein
MWTQSIPTETSVCNVGNSNSHALLLQILDKAKKLSYQLRKCCIRVMKKASLAEKTMPQNAAEKKKLLIDKLKLSLRKIKQEVRDIHFDSFEDTSDDMTLRLRQLLKYYEDKLDKIQQFMYSNGLTRGRCLIVNFSFSNNPE